MHHENLRTRKPLCGYPHRGFESHPLRHLLILSTSRGGVETAPAHATFSCMAEPQLQSTLTCPHCGHQATETMPTDACVAFYYCKGCGETLKPLPGSCCVFCSYGPVPCPPIQAGVEPRCSPKPDQSPKCIDRILSRN